MYKIGDLVTYCQKNGSKMNTIITKIDGNLIHVEDSDYDYQRNIVVHRNNIPRVSQDWLETS